MDESEADGILSLYSELFHILVGLLPLIERVQMLLEGLQLGHYRLLRLIGSGGMGEVYLAEDPRIGQQVAIKVLRTETGPDPLADVTQEAVRLFEREARTIALLDHPHILPLYGFGDARVNDILLTYLVMPYRKEGSLATWIRQHSGLPLLSPQEVEHFVRQAADALQYAHEHQIIHRDVKPSNFLLRSRRDTKWPDLLLADFGIAKFMNASPHTGQLLRGTPTYMAPEQWRHSPVPATDQYALAIMSYELLTGRPPFQGSLEQMRYQHFNTAPQPPSTLNPRIPVATDTVILQALAKNPEGRFASIFAFAQAFQMVSAPDSEADRVVMAHDPPSEGHPKATAPAPSEMAEAVVTPPPVPKTATKTVPPSGGKLPPTLPPHRSRGRTALLILLLLLVVGGGAGFYYFASTHPKVFPVPSLNPVVSNSFVHQVTTSNRSADWTDIDNPLTNNKPNAMLMVTQNWNPGGGGGGVYNNHTIGVWYHNGKWAIFNEDRAAITLQASFNVEILQS